MIIKIVSLSEITFQTVININIVRNVIGLPFREYAVHLYNHYILMRDSIYSKYHTVAPGQCEGHCINVFICISKLLVHGLFHGN